jgi:phosphoglycolate phosphatase-like HAD superfamily hydrolase
VLNHLKLLVWDLDYLVFDCSALKVSALRQSLISFAESIPQSVRLPDAIDAEGGYLDYGFRWPQFLEIGLDEERLGQFQRAFHIHQDRHVQAGVGRVYPGVHDFLMDCRKGDIRLALGAEASRDYLLAVTDQHSLDNLFDIALCTEEFGVGSADEMFEEIMNHTEVYPSETLVLGTRPAFFQAAHNLDLLTVGCGWGLHQQYRLAEADLQAPALSHLHAVIEQADHLSNRYSS